MAANFALNMPGGEQFTDGEKTQIRIEKNLDGVGISVGREKANRGVLERTKIDAVFVSMTHWLDNTTGHALSLIMPDKQAAFGMKKT